MTADGFQIVFLVDSNPSFWGHKSKAEYARSTIRLCVLKLLNYFSNLVKWKQTTLRWGYKFFVSNSLSHHFERHEFKEFSINAFEEFENLVLKKLDESFRRHGEHEQNKNHVHENIDRDNDEVSSSKNPPVGAKCVSCALTNTVHDFQWIKPDVSSPVKIKSRGNLVSGDDNSEGTRNIVFLLSFCPCDDVSISSFIGENAVTLDSFNNLIMPAVLFKEFKERCNIRLFWVNIGSLQQNTSLTSLLDDFLKQLGGCLIPISSLVYTGDLLSQPLLPGDGADCYNNNKRTCKGSFFCGAALPFKSVMDFYLCQKKGKAYDVCNLQKTVRKSQNFNESNGWLCSTGGGDKIHCAVILNSMFNTSSFQAPDENPTSEGIDGVRISPNLLWIRGVVKQGLVCPSWLHPMKAYSCVGVVVSSATTDQKDLDQFGPAFFSVGNLSAWFQELLLSLAKESKLLVLDFADPNSGAPVTGILQPLTSVCGVISVISSAFLLTFEKLLCWNGKGSLKNNSSQKTVAHISRGISLRGQRSTTSAINEAVKPDSKEIFLSLPGSQSFLSGHTVGGLKQFEAGFLDPWCCFSDAIEQEPICSELLRATGSDEDEDSENEASLMKELKDLYDKQHLTSESTASRQRQTPKKMAKNKFQTATRSSPRLRCRVDQKTSEDNSSADVRVTGNEIDLHRNLNMVQEGDISDVAKIQNASCEIKGETQLISIVHDMYNKVSLEGETLPQDLASIVELVTKFFQNKQEQKNCASQFLEQHLVLPITRLQERYKGCQTATSKEQRFRQYQLQILLRHEIADMSKADESSPLAEEVIVMLRAISFMKDPNFLSVYLREVLLQRYKSRIPRFLCAVYEGLMMQPPREVLSPSKWSSDEESPVRRPVESHSSTRQASNQPRSNGSRVLTRHTSVTEMPGKRREIVVPGKAKPKAETRKKEKEQGVNKRKEKDARGQGTPVKLVRRNLFTEAEGSSENGSVGGGPRKRKASDWGRKDERRRKFRRRNTIASFSGTTVQETPAHKQVSNALWCKQDRARKRSQALTDDVQVLQESPLKEIQTGEVLPRRSPRRLPGITFQRSRSFYRSSTSTGPLTRTKSFTATGTRDSPKKGFLDGSPFSSSKEASLKRAPRVGLLSPLRFSPRHKKKFSLHSLLATSKECVTGEHSKSGYRKPTTPKATRSSPRILKTRSFSCIGFSSVPFESYHGNEERLPAADAEPRGDAGRCNTPVKENVKPGAVLPETALRTPKKENPREGLLETGMITPKSKNRLVELRTPSKNLEMDDCVVYLTPIKKSLTSPKRLSPELRGADVRTRDHTQSLVAGELEPSEASYRACSDSRPADKSNLEMAAKRAIGPRIRCSTRLQGKLKEAVPSIEESDECCHNVAVAAVETVLSSIFSPLSTAKLKTPTKTNSLDDCVVLLTPVKHTVTSPKHVSFEGKRGLVMCSDTPSQRGEEPIMRTSEVNDDCYSSAKEATTRSVGRLFVSAPSPLHFSGPEADQRSPQPTCPDFNPSEKRPKFSSLKLTTKWRPVKSLTCPSHGGETENAFFDQTCVAGVYPGDEVREKMESGPDFVWIPNRDSPQQASDYDIDSLVADRANASVSMCDVAIVATGGSPAGSQSPRNQRGPHSTPPPKKTKKTHGVPRSPAESKRASPLNQILRQQKRKRDFPSPPAEKCARAPHASPRATNVKPTPLSQRSRNPEELDPRAVIEDNTSRSPEDAEDWVREMENDFERSAANYNDGGCNAAPSAKKRRLDKSVVFGKKTTLKKTLRNSNHKNSSSTSSDTSFEDEDEVFQSPSVISSRIKKWRINRTPLSASSIKVLQESPILLDSKLPVSPSSLTRKWSDSSSRAENGNQKDRLRRRFPNESDSNAVDAFGVDDEEPIGFHLRKRLKLGTS